MENETVLIHTLTHIFMFDSTPDTVKETYLMMKREQGKKLELKVIGENIACMLQRSYGRKREKGQCRRRLSWIYR